MSKLRTLFASLLLCTVATLPGRVVRAEKPEPLVAPEQRGVDGRGSRSLAVEEEEPPPDGPAGQFGQPATWAFSSDAALLIQRATQSRVSGAVTSVTLSPATDFFLARNFSLGGFASFTYTKTGDNHSTRIAVGPRLGFNIPFAKRASVWPKLGFSYAHTSSSVMSSDSTPTMRDVDQNALALNFFVPVMFHPVSNFFLGFGPFLDTDMTGDNRTTVWGAKLTLGGWL